ncbi:hypothetical protein AVEN_123601-1 [Araneus ventricosus]|uniref:Uncharacterized protein n=1 Tax=Araneus ventricosus TaxID=182803 RepID=A0A4Y2TIB0_ARAVE|nr:hypothetical protein AVEN_123601-1 [Araneus ventricosus]
MYSDTLLINWPDWTDAAYITELLQVINWYELYHLYKVFVKSNLQQVRFTRNPVLIECRLLRLDIVNGSPINNASYTRHVNPNPEYELSFQIPVRKIKGLVPGIHTLCSRNSPSTVYAQVNLEVIKNREGKAFGRVLPFHVRDCIIDPDATVECGPVLFLGCPETLWRLQFNFFRWVRK